VQKTIFKIAKKGMGGRIAEAPVGKRSRLRDVLKKKNRQDPRPAAPGEERVEREERDRKKSARAQKEEGGRGDPPVKVRKKWKLTCSGGHWARQRRAAIKKKTNHN